MRTSVFLTILSFVIFGLPFFAIAQISPNDLSSNLTVRIIPEFPKPNEFVSIRISSSSYNLDSASIIWTANGREVARGIGLKEATLFSGDIGETTKLLISVNLLNGSSFEREVVIRPSSVSFVWEAKTYTPPFYKGKSLFTPESELVIVAVPNMVGPNGPINPNDIIYKWTRNRQVLNNQSGYGKQSLSVIGSFWGRDEVVSVEVTSREGSISSKGELTIHPQKPKVFIYEDSPLLGILFNRAVGIFNINQNNEVSFFAAPFYFSSNSLSGGKTQYNWSMNRNPIQGNENGNSITFRAESGQSGTSLVGIKIEQDGKTDQRGETQFSINFK